MAVPEAYSDLMREGAEGAAEVKPIELFFDLVYVLAVTQLTHHLLGDLTLRGATQTLLLLLAVWGAWIHTAWVTNYFDLGTRSVRLVLIGVMLASLIMSASLPEAFTDRGLTFAVSLAAVLAVGTIFPLVVTVHRHHLGAVFERVLIWWTLIGVLWLVGSFVHGAARLAIWALAAGSIYVVMWLGFPLPVLGRSRTTDYTIAGEHMAHRCLLFIILALGESILVTGANFGALPNADETTAAFVVAFLGSVALWWVYFDRGAEAGLRVIAEADDPGHLGLTAYTFFHIPMVAGIIAVAAGDDQAIAHPGDAVSVTTAGLILGGPALFLVGHALFKWALWEYVSWSRFVAVLVLVALIPLVLVVSNLVLLSCATAVVAGVAAWDTMQHYALE